MSDTRQPVMIGLAEYETVKRELAEVDSLNLMLAQEKNALNQERGRLIVELVSERERVAQLEAALRQAQDALAPFQIAWDAREVVAVGGLGYAWQIVARIPDGAIRQAAGAHAAITALLEPK